MTFKDLIDLALDRIDEDTASPDPVALNIMKNGLNTAYILIATTVDPKTKLFEYPYESPKQIPNDFNTLINIEHDLLGELSSNDFEQRADLIYIRNKAYKTGNIKLTYVFQPEKLTVDDDVVQVKDMYMTAIAAYGAYVYQLHRRKYQAAQMLMNEFSTFIGGEAVETQ